MTKYYEFNVTRSNNDSFEIHDMKYQVDFSLAVLRDKRSSQEDIEDAIDYLKGCIVFMPSDYVFTNQWCRVNLKL